VASWAVLDTLTVVTNGPPVQQARAIGKRIRRAVVDTQRFGWLLGESPTMQRVFDLVARVAESEASVLVMGKTGTGKELRKRAAELLGLDRRTLYRWLDRHGIPGHSADGEQEDAPPSARSTDEHALRVNAPDRGGSLDASAAAASPPRTEGTRAATRSPRR